MLFRAYEQLRKIERTAGIATKKVRRSAQQRKDTIARQDYRPTLPNHSANEQYIVQSKPGTAPVQAFDDIDEDIST